MRRLVFALVASAFAISLTLFAGQDAGTRFAVAIERGDADAVKALLDEGVPVDTPIDYGEHKITPLMKAAWEGDVAIIEMLIAAGANVNAAASDTGETALLNAVTREHSDVVAILLKHKPDVSVKNAFGFNALTSAVAAGNQEIAAMLLDAGAKIDDGAHGMPPLQFAASGGKVDMIRFLVKRGADVNYGVKSGGQTALLYAIFGGHIDAVKALIELKASVNSKTKDGETPLTAAGKGDQTDIIAILKAAGAKR
ncbi:MAG: ankyrin repeat domain-containing protein [Thermoanaerobaculia bacterium]